MLQRSPHDSQSHKEAEPEDFGVVLVEGLGLFFFPRQGTRECDRGID